MNLEEPKAKSISRWSATLFRSVDNASLGAFRIMFGLCIVWFTWTYYDDYMLGYISRPGLHFTHFGFDWVRPWPGDGVYYHIMVLKVLSVLITLGLFYRVSVVLFFFGFTYIFLLESTINRTHPYLFCLTSFLLIFMPAHRAYSMDALLWPKLRQGWTPEWAIWSLRLQYGLVYFFAGLAKFNLDWINGEPLRSRMRHMLVGDFFLEHNWALLGMCHAGLLFDLLVPFGLAFRKTRLAAWVISVLFHVTNSMIWDLDVLPYLMIACTLIFFDADWPKQVAAYIRKEKHVHEDTTPQAIRLRWPQVGVLLILAAHFTIQILVPLRHFAYPGNVLWTGEGHFLAWRMMSVRKVSIAKFYARDPKTGTEWEISPRDFGIPYYTHNNPWVYPDNLVLFARYATNELGRQGIANAEIRATVYASLAGRRPQLLIDPEVNLAEQPRSLLPKPWIFGLKEPLPTTPDERAAALEEWERLGGDPEQF